MNYKNNAQAPIKTAISAGSTTLVLDDGLGALFPVAPFRLTLEKFTDGKVVKREIIDCTARSNDILTIVRAVEPCPMAWDSASHVQTAYSFDAGDIVSLNLTAKQIEDINAAIDTKLNDDWLRTWLLGKKIIVTDSTGNETYLSWTEWEIVSFDANGNPVTLTEAELTSLISSLPVDISTKNTVSSYIFWEDMNKWDSCFLETQPTLNDTNTSLKFWDDSLRTRLNFQSFGYWIAWNSIKLPVAKVGSPSATLSYRIETDNAGVPSGTLVDPNAYGSIVAWSLTSQIYDKAHGVSMASTNTSPQSYWVDFVPSVDVIFNRVTKHSSCTATMAVLKNSLWATIDTATFSWDVATFTERVLLKGVTYKIELDNNTLSYTYVYATTGFSYPITVWKITYTAGSGGTTSYIYNITSIGIFDPVETTLTLNSSITISHGTPVWIVCFAGSYWSETINSSNYYQIGSSSMNTNTRLSKVYNWTVHSHYYQSESTSDTPVSYASQTTSFGYRFQCMKDGKISGATRVTWCTATRCRLFTDTWVLIASTTTLSGNDFSFATPISIVAWTYYKIELDSSGSSYAVYRDTTPANITTEHAYFISGSTNWGTPDSNAWNIASLNFVMNIFPRIEWSIFAPTVLSKADTTYTYKFLTEIQAMIAKNSWVKWTIGYVITSWECDVFTNLTPFTKYYDSTTPGILSTTVSGSYVWKSVSEKSIMLTYRG